MRTIKFRAWDNERKVILQPKDLCHLEGNLSEELRESSPYLEIMQYTGLKDSKRTVEYPEGQEIYEGDIVKCHTGNWWPGVVTWQAEGAIGWSVEPYDCQRYAGRYGMNTHYVFEVIGNVHENPELQEARP